MAEFLVTSGITHAFERIVQASEGEVTIITPYLRLTPTLLQRLKDASSRGVTIRLVYGKTKLAAGERDKLRELKSLELFFLGNLHAKCYANENRALVASMNLYEHSINTNREMGVLLSKDEDPLAFKEATDEIASILNAAEREERPGLLAGIRSIFAPVEPAAPRRGPATSSGFCIRCGGKTRYRPQSPLCTTCYPKWAAWGNEDYPEKSCHRCGKSKDTTKAKPLCGPCFKQAPFTVPA